MPKVSQVMFVFELEGKVVILEPDYRHVATCKIGRVLVCVWRERKC